MPLPQEELEEIKQDYLDSLQDLTINSRPLIRDLTMIAQETLYAAQYIVKAVEEHINRAPPQHKLPALYLLDSICKNVGSPYTIYFSQNLSKIFINTYTLMEPHLRMKMEELLQTWKQPVPGTNSLTPVFSQEITRKIDGLLNKIRQLRLQHDQQRKLQTSKSTLIPSISLQNIPDHSSGIINLGNVINNVDYMGNNSLQTLLPTASNVTVNSLLVDISSLLTAAQKRVLLNPNDEIALKQIPALIKLQSILQISALPARQLSAIKEQLTSLSLQQQQNILQPVHYYPIGIQHNTSSINILPNTQSTDTEALLASLRSAGLLTDDSKNSTNDVKPFIPLDSDSLTLSSLALLNSSLNTIELNSASLAKHRPELVVLLYECMSLQCHTCAKRFEDTEDGRKRRDAHLDWHFRINNRLREIASRGQSRSWYFDEEEWIKYVHEDVTQVITELPENNSDKPNKHKEFSPDDSYVLTPTDPNAANEPCPICKEKFISVWNEDVEEWVWKNAISIENVIYHAICLSEASVASQTLFRENAFESTIQNEGSTTTVLGKRKATSE